MSRERTLDELIEVLDNPGAPRDGKLFFDAVTRLDELAETGSIEAARMLAEILAFPGPAHDPAASYKWYYIALSQMGYSVAFEDTGEGAPFYCGPVGDFRNESLVSDLVAMLGLEKILAAGPGSGRLVAVPCGTLVASSCTAQLFLHAWVMSNLTISHRFT